MTINKNDAPKYTCPFHQGMCQGELCMAWRFDITDELDIEKTKKYNKDWDENQDEVRYPVFKLSTEIGYCELIEKDIK